MFIWETLPWPWSTDVINALDPVLQSTLYRFVYKEIDSDSNILRNLNLCSYTNFYDHNNPLSKKFWEEGKCDARCWKDFFNVQYGRQTPCNGDRGTSLMVEEGGITNLRNFYNF